jgi:hypothetical protein
MQHLHGWTEESHEKCLDSRPPGSPGHETGGGNQSTAKIGLLSSCQNLLQICENSTTSQQCDYFIQQNDNSINGQGVNTDRKFDYRE